jgi:hypothetical protein
MIQKNVLRSIAIVGFASALIFSSCKKKEEKEPEPDQAAIERAQAAENDGGQTGTDNREVQEENDVASNEINDVISNSKRLGGRSSVIGSVSGPCGFDVDSVKIAKDTILFKYNGVTCNNRTRTGTIRLTWTAGTKWKVAGSVIKIEYLNYKVVRASDQRSFTLNGVQQLKNESGGNWVDLLFSNQTLVTSITGSNLQVTFSDGKTAVYNVNRKATYTLPGGILTAKLEGIGSSNGLNNLENFGTTRNGDAFTSQVSTPIVWNLTCGGAVIQGAVSITNTTKNFTVSFLYGVDQNGNPQTVGANQCPYGWKFEWPGVNGANSKVFGYK